MADDVLRLEADAVQYINELGRAVDALKKFELAQEKTIAQFTKSNLATGQLQSSLSVVAGEAGKAAASFVKVGKEWQLIGGSISASSTKLTEIPKNLNTIAKSAALSAVKMGDFVRATAAANLIPSAKIRETTLAKVATAQVQQPIVAEQFTRNLRRGFEQDINALPLIARNNFKEVERQFVETGAQLGLTWEQFNKKFKAIQAGKIAIAPEGDVARFQAAGLAYAKEIEKRQAAVQRLGQIQATAAEMNVARMENEQKLIQKYGSLQAAAYAEDASRTQKRLANTQQAGRIQATAIEMDQKRTTALTSAARAQQANVQKLGQIQATAAEENQRRMANEQQMIQKYGSLQAAAYAEDASRTQKRLANTQQAGKIQATAIEMDQKRTTALTSAARAQQDYDTFNKKLNANLLTLTDTTTKNVSSTARSVEVLKAVDAAGSAHTATVIRENGVIKDFVTVSSASATASANAAKVAENRAAVAKQETLAVQGATGFYNQLGKSMVELTPRTVQQNIATGESIERYRTLNKQGQEVITTIEKQGNTIKGMTQQVQDQTAATKSLLLSWQSMIRLLTIQVLHQAVYALMNAMQQAVEAAKNLQINIALIQTISEKGLNVEQWSKGILAVSDATGLLAEDVAKGTYDTLSNQIADGAEALEFMARAGKFAVTTNSTLQESVNALSSAINSYGLSTKDTTRISDIFFRMIDLGRIQAKDFSNEIGRILPGAQQLGVRLEEVAAVLSTLTRSGVTPAAAMTSLFNIFSRLLKPAGEMKEFLKQLGVTSGQAAIQTYGFAQVLAKVAEFAQGKPEILAQLFPDIRGLRGILRLAGDGLKDFNTDLKGIEDSSGATEKALESFANNTGKRFQIELNKVRNYFTGTFGTEIITKVVKVSDAVGGLSNAVKILSNELFYIGSAVIVSGLVKTTAGIIAALASSVALTGRLATVMTFLKANPAVAIIAVVAAGLGYLQKLYDDETEKADKLNEQMDEFLKKTKEINAATTEKALKPVDDAIKKQTAGLGLLLANISIAYDATGKKLVDENEKIIEGFKEVHDSFVSYLGDSLNKVREDLRKTKDTLKDIKTFESTGQMKIDEQIRKIRLDDADTAIEKQKLLNEELAITTQEMLKEQNRDRRVALFEKAKGIVEDIHKLDRAQGKEAIKDEKERNKALEEKRKLEQELINITKKQEIAELEKRKKINTEAKKGTITTVGGRIVSPTGANQNLIEQKDQYGDEQRKQRIEEIKAKLREINAVLKDTTPQYKKQNDLVRDLQKLREEMLRLDREQAIVETQKVIELARQAEEMKQAVKDANEAFKAIEKVKFDKLVDPNTAQDKFKEILDGGTEAVETLSKVTQKFAGKDYEKQVQYAQELAKVKANLEATAEQANKRRAINEVSKQIDALNAVQQEKRKKLVEEMNARRDTVSKLSVAIVQQLPGLNEIKDYINSEFKTGGFGNVQDIKDGTSRSKRDKDLINQVISVVEKIKGGDVTSNTFNELKKLQIGVLSAANDSVYGVKEQFNNLSEIITQILKREPEIAKQNAKVDALRSDIDKTVTAIDAMTKTMSEKFGVDLGKLFENSHNMNKLVGNTENIYQAIVDGFRGLISGLSPEARAKALTTDLAEVESKKNARPAPAEIKGTPSGPPEGWKQDVPVTVTTKEAAPLPVVVMNKEGKPVITNIKVPELKTIESVQLPSKITPFQEIRGLRGVQQTTTKPVPVMITTQEGKQLMTNNPELIRRAEIDRQVSKVNLDEVYSRPKGPGGIKMTAIEFGAIMKAAINTRDEKLKAVKPTLHDGVVVRMPSMEQMLTETAAALKAADFENRAKAVIEAEIRTVQALEQNGTNITMLGGELVSTTVAINRLREMIANMAGSTQTVTEVTLPPKPFAMGGLHGSDTIPAMLAKGEFVVNAKATRRFYSQLVNMNSMRGFANGGLVTNNVGDINVSMQATGGVQSDIVAIGKGLQREIRRGRIRF